MAMADRITLPDGQIAVRIGSFEFCRKCAHVKHVGKCPACLQPECIPSPIQPLTKQQVERIRLLLSTYQDGSGRDTKDRTLPGWEDFEDVTEIVFEGTRLKGKSAVDIVAPGSVGISCKMTKTLNYTSKQVLIEHSRINAEFFNKLKEHQIARERMFEAPQDCGQVLLSLVKEKRLQAAEEHNVDLAQSFFLVMAYDVKTRQFRLFQFPLKMPRSDKVTWTFSDSRKHLRGMIGNELVIQWFHEGGGQLKYYPSLDKATWLSDVFELEPLDHNDLVLHPAMKAEKYFKEKWNAL